VAPALRVRESRSFASNELVVRLKATRQSICRKDMGAALYYTNQALTLSGP
jgi:hypothetical protein